MSERTLNETLAKMSTKDLFKNISVLEMALNDIGEAYNLFDDELVYTLPKHCSPAFVKITEAGELICELLRGCIEQVELRGMEAGYLEYIKPKNIKFDKLNEDWLC